MKKKKEKNIKTLDNFGFIALVKEARKIKHENDVSVLQKSSSSVLVIERQRDGFTTRRDMQIPRQPAKLDG